MAALEWRIAELGVKVRSAAQSIARVAERREIADPRLQADALSALYSLRKRLDRAVHNLAAGKMNEVRQDLDEAETFAVEVLRAAGCTVACKGASSDK